LGAQFSNIGTSPARLPVAGNGWQTDLQRFALQFRSRHRHEPAGRRHPSPPGGWATSATAKGTLGKLVTDETLYIATTASMTNLNQILLKINQGQGTVGKLVNDQEFYKKCQALAAKAGQGCRQPGRPGPAKRPLA